MSNQRDKEIRRQAMVIAAELSQEESAIIVFLCRDFVKGYSVNGEVKELFEILSKQNLLKLDLLTELLHRIRRLDILRKMKVDTISLENNLRAGKGYVTSYRQLLVDISENLSQEDLRSVLFLLSCQIPKGHLETVKTFLDLVVELEKSGKIDENNLAVVEDCLTSIRRIDLIKKISKYKQMGDCVHSARRSDAYQNVIPISIPRQECGFGPEHIEQNWVISSVQPVITNQLLRQHVHSNCPRLPVALSEEHSVTTLSSPMPESAQATALGTSGAVQQFVAPVQHSRAYSKSQWLLSSHIVLQVETVSQKIKGSNSSLGTCARTWANIPEVPKECCKNRLGTYKMQSNPTGLCLIIDCIGTDADLLKKTFEALHFHVLLHLYVELNEMEKILKETSERDDLTTLDCFVCCIVSRGTQDCILAVDGNSPGLYFEQIQRYFKGQQCRPLLGKPRLFFVQDFLVSAVDSELEIASAHSNGDPIQVDGNDWEEIVPQEADILWCCCQVSQSLLHQAPQQPSSFMHTLSKYLRKYQHKSDLISILTEVNRKTMFRNEQLSQLQPTPLILRHTLRKKLIFP